MTIKSRLCGVGYKWSFCHLTSGLFATCVALLLVLCLVLPAWAVVSSSTARVEYNGNGSTTIFAVPFYFLDDDDLKVVLVNETTGAETTQTKTTNYTVSGAADPAGGSVTMLTPPTSNEQLVIVRNMSALQPIDLTANAQLPAETLEVGYDRLTMLVQQNIEKLNRSFKFSEGYTGGASVTMPSPTASRYLRWNSDGDALENVAVVSAGTVTISGFAETLLDDADAAAMLTTLGAYSSTETDSAISTALSTRAKEIRFTLMGTITTGTKLVQAIPGFSGTITAIKAVLDSGTSATITIKNGASTVYAGLVVDSTGVTQTASLTNAAVTAYSKLQVDVTGASGTPTNLVIYIEITKS